jgi:hypothetical protein
LKRSRHTFSRKLMSHEHFPGALPA